MPCYYPLRACLPGRAGQPAISFNRSDVGKAISLPCGRCIGCRLERARQWAVRIMHESQMHEESSFITLTYDDEHLPVDRSLDPKVSQRFFKALRHAVDPHRIRFFIAGEYGETCQRCDRGRKACRCLGGEAFKIGRPHYHAIVFGYGFPDKIMIDGWPKGLYYSQLLSDVWGNGYTSVGSVAFESASYVANYATKKICGKGAAAHYEGRRPEFLLMSRRPGIGKAWIEKFSTDVYPRDEVIVRSKQTRPPRFYDQQVWAVSPDNFLNSQRLLAKQHIKERRSAAAEELEEVVTRQGRKIMVSRGNDSVRLAVRGQVAEAKLRLKSRGREIGS